MDSRLTVHRFSRATRLWHWTFSLSFLGLLLTGLTNFWPELKAWQLGDERFFAWLHVLAGFAMLAALPLLGLSLLARSRAFRRDIAQAHRLGAGDYLWLQEQGVRLIGQEGRPPPPGKFNGGQKLNTWLVGLLSAGLGGTGLVLGLQWIDRGRLDIGFVESVFPWHTALALLAVPLIAGHLLLALVVPQTRESLRGITGGRVSARWAQRHHPAWRPEDEPPR